MTKRTTAYRLTLLFGAALMMAGCAAGIGPQTEAQPAAERLAALPIPPWWDAFGDASLSMFVTQATSRNVGIEIALARLDEAAALAAAAGAGQLPQARAGASAGRTRTNGTGPSDVSSVTLEAGWAIDLFGGVRSARSAAIARQEVARQSLDGQQLLVSGLVTETYIEARQTEQVLALTRQSLGSRRLTADLVRTAFDEGAATRLDVLQAEQLVARAEAAIPGLEAQRRVSLNRLARLLDMPARDIEPRLAGGAAIPRPLRSAVQPVVADLLRARPDVRAAEQAYVAAAADVGVARAALYPSLTLSGTVTAARAGGVRLPDTWSFGPALTLPLFSGGRLRAEMGAASARAEQARLQWEETVLTAVEETATSLALYSGSQATVAAQQRIEALSREAVRLGQDTVGLGEAGILSLLEAERDLLDAAIVRAEAERARALAFVRLSVATAGASFVQPGG